MSFALNLKRLCWPAMALAAIFLAAPSLAQSPNELPLPGDSARLKPDVDLYALMSGTCSTLRIAGRDFACKAVAYFHNEQGRANFTIALDDPSDKSHIVAFSGEYGRRTQDNLYVLSIDEMQLNSSNRPKVDGLPRPAVERSDGVCRQIGNFAARQVSSISCSATDRHGRSYQLQFVSDGSPITLRRVRLSAPTIRRDPYQ
jgi:hypothetical protein